MEQDTWEKIALSAMDMDTLLYEVEDSVLIGKYHEFLTALVEHEHAVQPKEEWKLHWLELPKPN